MLRLSTLAFALCLFLTPSCTDAAAPSGSASEPSQTGSPSALTQAFFKAVAADDGPAYEALMSDAAVAALHAGGNGSMSFDGKNLDSWQVGAVTLDGETASVAVTLEQAGEQQELALKLRKQNTAWRVYAMGIAMGDDEWLVSFEGSDDNISQLSEQLAEGIGEAFEGAAAEWQAGGSAAEIAAQRASYVALEALDREQYDASWQVDLEAAGRPGAELLAELLQDTGLRAKAESWFDAPSTLSLSASSRLAAIEALCLEAGVVPSYPGELNPRNGDETQIVFEKGTRTGPVAFEGPFMIEALELEEHAPHSTGELTIRVSALGLHPSLLAANDQMTEMLVIDQLQGSTGTNLLVDENTQWMGTPSVAQGLFSYSISPDLLGLLRGVESLTVAGDIVLRLPGEVHTARFGDGESDSPTLAGPWSVVWDKRSTYNNFKLTNNEGEQAAPGVRFAPNYASGEPMGVQSESCSSVFEHVSANLSTPEAPASLEIKVFAVEELRYNFQLEGIALAHYAEQPAQLKSLNFTGTAPISAEFKSFVDRSNPDFPKVSVSVANLANLGVQSAMVKFDYLDSAGKSVGDHVHNLTGEFTFEGTRPLADVGQTSTVESVAFFMPPETQSIRTRVEKVTFQNGTSWEAK